MFEVASVSQSSSRPLRSSVRPVKVASMPLEANWQPVGQAASNVLRALQAKFDSQTSSRK